MLSSLEVKTQRKDEERRRMMWPSVEEGPPEVTLETSMGSFTVEVPTATYNYMCLVLYI